MPTTYAIPNGAKVMDATLYAGNNSTQTVTNAAGFKPDLVWIKSRNTAGANHVLTDSVRGVSKFVISNLTDSEYTVANTLTSFNSNGFSLGNTAYDFNISGNNYVAWQWQAGQGSNTTNTSGTITSTVSANVTAGFSVVTFTGSGSAGTVGHGLGVAPSMIIVKDRVGAYNWCVYHASLGNTKAIYLNTNGAAATDVGYWNNTSPTSSVFTVNYDYGVNKASDTYVAYCWAPVAGFSQFGSYTGNGSADGPFIYTGFRPKFVLIKAVSGTLDWAIVDSTRNPYNQANLALYPDLAAAETSAYDLRDYVSNGFKIRTSDGNTNTNGTVYIYMAFAENPFKYANAR